MESQKKTAGRPPKPPHEKLSRELSISITESTYQALKKQADILKAKHQEIARQAIERAISSK